MKPHYETYRYTDELCTLKAQSIVECRLSGSEIVSVLAVHAKAVPTECVCADGEVRYGGKLLLNIVYEDAERNICRAERGAEFTHKAENSSVTPACFARAALKAENITTRREGSGLYVSVIVGAAIPVYGMTKIDYLAGGEGLISKKTTAPVVRLSTVYGETEREDEFDTDYVGDILLHSENAVVTGATADAGQIDIDGEMTLNICVLKSDRELCSYERLIPFHIRIPCEEAFGNLSVLPCVTVKSAHINAGTDEEKGKSKIVLSTTLAAECTLLVKDEINVIEDAFSKENEIVLKKEKATGRYLTNVIKYTERVGGAVALSEPIEEGATLLAAVLPRAEIECKKNARGEWDVEGIVQAEILFVTADGARKRSTLSLPIAFPVDTECGDEVQADAIVYGLNVKRRKNGEMEVEGALKLALKNYRVYETEYVSSVEIGEPTVENDSGISVFLPREGEGLWQVAKRLKCSPEDVEKNNPDLVFPVKGNERILIYRCFDENL